MFVDDVKNAIGDKVQLAQYADDLALWINDPCPRHAESILNGCLKRLDKWTSEWGIKLAPETSAAVLFSRRPIHRWMCIKLKLLGEEIKRVDRHYRCYFR